jgi:hypothetical protein
MTMIAAGFSGFSNTHEKASSVCELSLLSFTAPAGSRTAEVTVMVWLSWQQCVDHHGMRYQFAALPLTLTVSGIHIFVPVSSVSC